MTYRAFAAVLAITLGGCVTPGAWMKAPGDPVYILVKSNPDTATVTFTDGTTCQTPCRLGVVDPVQMTVARIGYAPVTIRVDQRSPSPMIVDLEAVGRSLDVEEFDLPDL